MNNDGEFEVGDMVYVVPRDEVDDPDQDPTYTPQMGKEYKDVLSYKVERITNSGYVEVESRLFLPEWLILVDLPEFKKGDMVYIIPRDEVEDDHLPGIDYPRVRGLYPPTETFEIKQIDSDGDLKVGTGKCGHWFHPTWVRKSLNSSPSRIMGQSPVKKPDLCPQCHADETYNPDDVMKAIHDSCRGGG